MINCPRAMPIRQAVMLSWTTDAEVFNSRSMAGKAGKYISREKGPNAIIRPRAKTVRTPTLETWRLVRTDCNPGSDSIVRLPLYRHDVGNIGNYTKRTFAQQGKVLWK